MAAENSRVTIPEIMKTRMTLSFEVFPPKTDLGYQKLTAAGGALDRLYTLNPDFISCTYGAGGTNVGAHLDILDIIAASEKTIPVAHFTCRGNSRADAKTNLQKFLEHGITHLLAIRGDLPYGSSDTGSDLRYATELVKLARDEFGDRFTVSVTGSPEGHVAGRSFKADIAFLKQKQDEGASFITTQLCWDMDQFRRWMDEIRRAGVFLPVDVGIMPITDIGATINMALSRNACVIPRALALLISKYWIFPNPFKPDEPEELIAEKKAAFREAGLQYTIRLIDEYRVCGISGIHLYTLNKFDDVSRIILESGIKDY